MKRSFTDMLQISAKVNSLGYRGHEVWKKNAFFKRNSFFVNNFCSNQDRAILLAPLRLSRQDGSNGISFDPVWSTSKFARREYMGSNDPDDPGDPSNILHLEHQEYPKKAWLWRI